MHNGAVTDTGGTEPTGSPSLLYKAGIWLVTIGVVLIGYGAWEYWGTDILAKYNQERTVEELIKAWADPEFDAPKGAFAVMRIPRFGDDYEVPVLEGIEDDTLKRGLGHYPQTALPGEYGNFAVAGHRVTHGEPFREFPKLRPGDEVEVETADAVYTYVIDNDPGKLVVQPYDGWVLEPIPPGTRYDEGQDEPTQALITLTTCGAVVHTSDRMIAFGHLVETVDK